ncbi:MAG TPA: hypothetical protein DCL61_11550 [Cyanobacteria bacterium UBA12227]|nr:hypothetical protein [Cyanobacteria bacterium UBA12227]HAX88699.1 hypothetical protein [Cyanobacteria bacterium UBA11370]HBY81269.1 hypothetical protein [Cyanobacteria bacterium UBA11148]
MILLGGYCSPFLLTKRLQLATDVATDVVTDVADGGWFLVDLGFFPNNLSVTSATQSAAKSGVNITAFY